MLTQKRLRQNEAADGKKEQHAAAAAIDQVEDVVMGLEDKGMVASQVGLAEDMRKQSRDDGNEAQTVDLGNPAPMRCNPAKFHSIPDRSTSPYSNETQKPVGTAQAIPIQDSNSLQMTSSCSDARRIRTDR